MKNKSTAGILAILLGGLGVHKFYLGKTGIGIVYLLFFWTGIPVIVGLIEGIQYLTMSDNKFNHRYNLEEVLNKERVGLEQRRDRIIKELKEDFIKKYGEEKGMKLFNREMWVGMTKTMLIEAFGSPEKHKETLNKGVVKENYLYTDCLENKFGEESFYNVDVSIENDVVVGWKKSY